jgi:hypothetical protein
LYKYIVLISKGQVDPSSFAELIAKINNKITLSSNYFAQKAKFFATTQAPSDQVKKILRDAQDLQPVAEDERQKKWEEEVEKLLSENESGIGALQSKVTDILDELRIEHDLEDYDHLKEEERLAIEQELAEKYLESEDQMLVDLITTGFVEDKDGGSLPIIPTQPYIESLSQPKSLDPLEARVNFLKNYVLVISKGNVDPMRFDKLIRNIAERDKDLTYNYQEYALHFNEKAAEIKDVRKFLQDCVEFLTRRSAPMQAQITNLLLQYQHETSK